MRKGKVRETLRCNANSGTLESKKRVEEVNRAGETVTITRVLEGY